MPASARTALRADFDPSQLGREIIHAEAAAMLVSAEFLAADFTRATKLFSECRGAVIVAGIGKAGLVGQKLSATFASTGTRSYFLHPTEALHGDLGRVEKNDIVLILSFSGETEEIAKLLSALTPIGPTIVAVTSRAKSTLAKKADLVLDIGPIQEACPLGLAPSASTAAMMALGDALALVASRLRGFSADDFARYHPGGSLGKKLTKVEEVQRPLAECRTARDTQTVREVFVSQSRPGRRTGAIMLTDAKGVLTGIFTDSDLARLFERKHDAAIDRPIGEVMTRKPASVKLGVSVAEACDVLADKKISELPVVDAAGRPVGMIDITDLVGVSFPPDKKAVGVPAVLKIHAGAPTRGRASRVKKTSRKRT